jgi:hypothetical protein
MTSPWEETDPDELKKYLMRIHGTTFGATDEELHELSIEKKAVVRNTGRRWSWTALAAEQLYKGAQNDGDD